MHSVASKLGNWRVASYYGLFRSMTGVGRSAVDDWGLPVSVPARPELIVEGARLPAGITEGSVSADDLQWEELPFRHKPGDVAGEPTSVVPF